MLGSKITSSALVAAALLLAPSAFAEDKAAAKTGAASDPADDGSVVQKIGHGEINWSKKTVTATGSGVGNLKDGSVAVARLNAERAAKLDALRNIIETIQGIQVAGGRNAGDLMSNGEIKSKIMGIAQGFKVVDTKYYSDGSVDVVVSMPIDENLTSALIQTEKAKGTAMKVPTAGNAAWTGLVVNAKGLGVSPSMAPRILDEAGKEVYGAAVVTEKGLQQGGIASYAKAGDTTLTAERAGQKPFVVKALRVDKAKTDIVISNADAEKLRDPNSNLSFLADGKVVIVVD